MLSIPPIKYTIAKYRAAFTARLSRLPPTAILRTILIHDQAAFYVPPTPVPTPLTSLLPSSFPAFCIPTNLTWTHPRVHNALITPKSDALLVTTLQIANNPPPNHTSVHIYPIPHPDHSVAAYLPFQDGSLIACGFRSNHDRTVATTEAAIAGVLSLGPHPGTTTTIFMPNRTLHRPLFLLTKHKHLPQATLFMAALNMHCFLHPDISISVLPLPVKLNRKPSWVDPRTFACNWPGPRGKDFNLAELRAEAQLVHLPDLMPKPPLKSLPFRLWKTDQENCADPPRCKWTGGLILVPDSSLPSDLVIGALTLGQRCAMSAVLQVFFLHCFCGAYSMRMRPTSGDVTTCPCTYSQTPIPMIELDGDGDPQLKAKGDQDQFRGQPGVARPYAMPLPIVSTTNHGFVDLMAEFRDNPCRTPSHSPPPASSSSRRRKRAHRRHSLPPPPPLDRRHHRIRDERALHPDVLHSAPHILDSCPLVSIFRDRILQGASYHYLFWTVKGASALATFLLRSNSLLRPLPPRPDPP